MLTPTQARRFQAHALGLDTPFPDLPAALGHMGYVQIDPINVCGRMHDLILRNRVSGYREGQLHDTLYGIRSIGFEHFLGVLVAFPHAAWPHLQHRMLERQGSPHGYAGKLSRREQPLARYILDEIRERGPLTSDAIQHDGRAQSAWGTQGREVKIVLEKLFLHGRVLIAGRRHFRRIYDLTERVLPASVLDQSVPDKTTSARYLAHLRMQQRRLSVIPRADFGYIEDLVEPVQIQGCPLKLFCLKADRPLLEQAQTVAPPAQPRLLAPLDPLIYDRRLTAHVWDFHYTWEVYTPPAKRTRGYYALPLLSGDALVGHIDPKAERKSGRLTLMNRTVARGHRYAPAVAALAQFLGLKR
jgi:uncharacterized protein YcaQ